jgi:hypothetical protein
LLERLKALRYSAAILLSGDTEMKTTTLLLLLLVGCSTQGQDQQRPQTTQPSGQTPRASSARRPDAIEDAQTPRAATRNRPEQAKTERDEPARFKADAAQPSSQALKDQPDKGKILGFDFYRDPLNAKKPNEKPEDITAKDIADRPGVMDAQKKTARKPLQPHTETR